MESQQQETVLYGGAFNPPTLAHEAILQACVDYAEPRGADVWVVPSASRSDKSIEVGRERRLEYCQALTRDVLRRTVGIDVMTMELDRGYQTETYDTACELELLHPDRSFTWVFGADSVATMDTWHNGQVLKDSLSMLVVNRPGAPEVPLGARATRLDVDAGVLSSTELRRRMAAGERYDDIVGSHVHELLSLAR